MAALCFWFGYSLVIDSEDMQEAIKSSSSLFFAGVGSGICIFTLIFNKKPPISRGLWLA
jgi:hypothetical protein